MLVFSGGGGWLGKDRLPLPPWNSWANKRSSLTAGPIRLHHQAPVVGKGRFRAAWHFTPWFYGKKDADSDKRQVFSLCVCKFIIYIYIYSPGCIYIIYKNYINIKHMC